MHRTDDVRIKWTKVVLPPVFLEEEMPMTDLPPLPLAPLPRAEVRLGPLQLRVDGPVDD